jgi:hypothetical protein
MDDVSDFSVQLLARMCFIFVVADTESASGGTPETY